MSKHSIAVIGFPTPNIQWFHNNQDVTSSINYEVKSDGRGGYSLVIAEVFDEDAGTFTCIAQNGAGAADSSAELVVKSKITLFNKIGCKIICKLVAAGAVMPADFVQKLEGIIAVQGEMVRFEVRTIGVPPPTVKWYREGAEIRHSEDFQIHFDGDLHSLIIKEACEEDSGRFTAAASNQAGKATCSCTLKVTEDGATVASVRSTSGDFVAESPTPRQGTRKLSPLRSVKMSPPVVSYSIDI